MSTAERKRQLEEIARSLHQFLESTESSGAPVVLDQSKMGRVSRVDAMQQREMGLANRRSAQLRHQQVLQALKRIETGDYGDCLRCEERISEKRLEARPESPFCLECQSARES